MDKNTKVDPISKTGYDQIEWRPVGQMIALILSNDDLLALGSPHAEKPEKESKIVKKDSKILGADGKPKFYKRAEAEKEAKEQKKNNRTFTVAAISASLVTKEDAPEVGDEVSLQAGQMTEIIVNDIVYGLSLIHI